MSKFEISCHVPGSCAPTSESDSQRVTPPLPLVLMCGVTILLRTARCVDAFFGGFLDDISRSTVLNVGFRLDRIMDCLRPVHFQIFGGHRRNVVPNPRTMYWSVNSSLSAPSSALRALRTSATVRSRFCAEHVWDEISPVIVG